MSSVISGRYQGLKLSVPKKGTRPTSQRVKEAVFSTLNHYGLFENDESSETVNNNEKAVLDLYAGSGALGIETLSRGYNKAVFVDMGNEAIKCLKNNCSKQIAESVHKKEIEISYYQNNVNTFLKEENIRNNKYLLVFIDPPYDIDPKIIEENLQNCVELLTEESIIVLERSSRSSEIKLPEGLENFNTKKYGETSIYYIQKIVD